MTIQMSSFYISVLGGIFSLSLASVLLHRVFLTLDKTGTFTAFMRFFLYNDNIRLPWTQPGK